ncbi:hypothetical protein FC70_GL000158 [Paucilactobacillus oligofermentans DSM 15707 = LMG 22743]|uniref:CAAX prenyl protease 2/Lysostaphin resistance protein A-like domain-containing protein n=1 Tax=Paucilactobacillus oligofermentans DSM 15707 = LMG 22743 TaxID=1423778 RepID=A0A0R1RVN0_9LACO|nr:hypothetical protein FC70_GL000158 [Paucilactobacillus oligofermentans DSM 15707 = LMG 22743]CUS26993.1 Uncharacterized protein LACOL_1639 [Paucilactobacillus oligofermentans DSM 15707 = LMG 22743]
MHESNKRLCYLIGSYLLLILVLLTTAFSKIYWSLSTNLYSVIQEIIPLIITIVIIGLVHQKILLEINKPISIIVIFLLIIIAILIIPHLNSDNLITNIFILLLASIFEELYFRGYLLPQLTIIFKNRHKSNYILFSIFISSIIFGATHVVNVLSQSPFSTFIQIITACILGVILSIFYLRTRSIIIPIIVHFAFNVSTLSSAPQSLNNFSTTGIIPIIVYGFIAYLLIRSTTNNHYDLFLNSFV